VLTPRIAPPFPLEWGFTTRQDPEAAHPPERLVQVHGDRVVEASDTLQQADGLWTRTPGLAIGVKVADCVPVLLAGLAGGRPWAAALHAGWRGAVAGILRRGVAVFTGQGGRPEDLAWALGPAILKCHFEVGEEVLAAARRDPAWREDLAEPGPRGRPHLDLHGLLRAQALDLGLDPARDGSVALCTFCTPDLLDSYRRGDRSTRQWGWIRIGPPPAP
jgi:YfiH family protein